MNLPNTEVHVWRASVNAWSDRLEDLIATLAGDEMVRLGRYRVEADRRRFLVGRGLLRQIAGRYLGLAPAKVTFIYGEFGKPAVSKECELEFNLAHSDDLIVYAFARNDRLGIDIEKIDQKIDVMSSASEFCSAQEIQELAGLPVAARRQMFFRLWVQKEALLKASGDGFAGSARELVDACVAGESRWQVRNLEIDPDYAAALVFENGDSIVRLLSADEQLLR